MKFSLSEVWVRSGSDSGLGLIAGIGFQWQCYPPTTKQCYPPTTIHSVTLLLLHWYHHSTKQCYPPTAKHSVTQTLTIRCYPLTAQCHPLQLKVLPQTMQRHPLAQLHNLPNH